MQSMDAWMWSGQNVSHVAKGYKKERAASRGGGSVFALRARFVVRIAEAMHDVAPRKRLSIRAGHVGAAAVRTELRQEIFELIRRSRQRQLRVAQTGKPHFTAHRHDHVDTIVRAKTPKVTWSKIVADLSGITYVGETLGCQAGHVNISEHVKQFTFVFGRAMDDMIHHRCEGSHDQFSLKRQLKQPIL
jgi:hypothetical protein